MWVFTGPDVVARLCHGRTFGDSSSLNGVGRGARAPNYTCCRSTRPSRIPHLGNTHIQPPQGSHNLSPPPIPQGGGDDAAGEYYWLGSEYGLLSIFQNVFPPSHTVT